LEALVLSESELGSPLAQMDKADLSPNP